SSGPDLFGRGHGCGVRPKHWPSPQPVEAPARRCLAGLRAFGGPVDQRAVRGVVVWIGVFACTIRQRLCRLHGIVQQHCDSHRPDAARNGGNGLGVLDLVELDVADQLFLAIIAHDAGDADVDHDGAGLYPIALDEFGRAGGGDDDVSLAGNLGQVLGVDVRDGDGALALEQQHGDGLADDVRLADHHRVLADEIVDHRFEQHHHPERGAGHDAARTGRQAADVDRVESVDVLFGADRAEHRARVDVLRQRHLAQDAVDFRIVVELIDQRQQVFLRGVCRHAVLGGANADLFTALDLAADVDLAGAVVANQDHRQTRPRLARYDQGVDFGFGSVVQLASNRLAVDDVCHLTGASRRTC